MGSPIRLLYRNFINGAATPFEEVDAKSLKTRITVSARTGVDFLDCLDAPRRTSPPNLGGELSRLAIYSHLRGGSNVAKPR